MDIYREVLKLKESPCVYNYTVLNVHNYCIPVSDCVCGGNGESCTGMRSLDGAWEVSGRMASFLGVASVVQ